MLSKNTSKALRELAHRWVDAVEREALTKADDRRPLYVSRRVLNADEVLAWAKSQGFEASLPADDLHVTVAYSRAAVDWQACRAPTGQLVVKGGARRVAPLGDEGAVVLHIESDDLQARWQQLRDAGCSWDYEGYQPHVTITYAAPDGFDVASVKPYRGPLVLGPEEFAPLDEEAGRLEKRERPDHQVKIQVAGKQYFGIASSVQVSRLSAFGFLLEAAEAGIRNYRIDAVMDERTCAVCKQLDGWVFPVEAGMRQAQLIMDTDDVETLKQIAPFYAQNKQAVAELITYATDDWISMGMHLPPYHPLPVSEDTEFLSPDGWKLVKDAAVGDLCFSMNPDTGVVEWVPVAKVIHAGRAPQGRMVHFHSQNADLLVTEHHRQVYGTSIANLSVRPAGELLALTKVTIPRSGRWLGSTVSPFLDVGMEAVAELLAFWISDGSCTKRSDDSYQIMISTRKYAERAQELLTRVTGRPAHIEGGNVRCNDTRLGRYLLDTVGVGFNGKRIPSCITQADPAIIRVFLNAYLRADGSVCVTKGRYGESQNRVFYTSSPMLAAQLGELIVKAGGFPSYSLQDNSLNPQRIGDRVIQSTLPVHRIRWCTSKTATFGPSGKGTMELVPYDGETYCLSLERNFIFYVRRNGKCIWTGNCRCILTPTDAPADLHPTQDGNRVALASAALYGEGDGVRLTRELFGVDVPAEDVAESIGDVIPEVEPIPAEFAAWLDKLTEPVAPPKAVEEEARAWVQDAIDTLLAQPEAAVSPPALVTPTPFEGSTIPQQYVEPFRPSRLAQFAERRWPWLAGILGWLATAERDAEPGSAEEAELLAEEAEAEAERDERRARREDRRR
jgi:hypothetical protein